MNDLDFSDSPVGSGVNFSTEARAYARERNAVNRKESCVST